MSVGTSVVSIFNGHGHQGFAQGKWPKLWVPGLNGPSDITCDLKTESQTHALKKALLSSGVERGVDVSVHESRQFQGLLSPSVRIEA